MPVNTRLDTSGNLEIEHEPTGGWVPAIAPLRDPTGLPTKLIDAQLQTINKIEQHFKWGAPTQLASGAALLSYATPGGAATSTAATIPSNVLQVVLMPYFSANGGSARIRVILRRTTGVADANNCIIENVEITNPATVAVYNPGNVYPASRVVIPTYGCPQLALEVAVATTAGLTIYGMAIASQASA